MLQYQIKAEEERSTHFLAIRVTDPELVANLCRVQDSIVALDSNLRDCCIKPGLFHITIDQLRLEGPERVLRAMMERLRPVVEEMFEDQASAILDIDGLGNFGQRVVYAKVTHRLLFFSFQFTFPPLVKVFSLSPITLSPVQVLPRSQSWFTALVEACKEAISADAPLVIALQSF